MNYLLVTLVVISALLLGPVVQTCMDPWVDDPPRGGKGGAPVVKSSDPWGEDHPWEKGGKRESVFESAYGAQAKTGGEDAGAVGAAD